MVNKSTNEAVGINRSSPINTNWALKINRRVTRLLL